MEKAREYQKNLAICFIGYSKAFDCVDHNVLWNTLRSMGIPDHLTSLMRMLYNNQTAIVRTEYGDCETFNIEEYGKAVSSPHTYSICTVRPS